MAFEASGLQRALADALKDHREALGLTQAEVALHTGIDRTALSKKEGSKSPFENSEIIALGKYYKLDDERISQLCEMRRESRTKAWWSRFKLEIGPGYYEQISCEHDAEAAETMVVSVFDGLTQTPEYTTAVLNASQVADPDRVAMHLELRERRQRRLFGDRPLLLDCVFDEAILSRPYGGEEVLRGQLAHMLELAQLPHVTFRMLPSTAVVERAQFTVLRFGGARAPRTLIVDAMVTTAVHDDPRDIARASRIYAAAQQVALSPEATVAFIAETLKGI